jgi:hypothetical protein
MPVMFRMTAGSQEKRSNPKKSGELDVFTFSIFHDANIEKDWRLRVEDLDWGWKSWTARPFMVVTRSIWSVHYHKWRVQ